MKLSLKFCSLLLLGTLSLHAAPRPNMLLFLADDCTYRDIGCYGSVDSRTPNIDRLATEGMKFTKCYQAAPMCSPTRHNLYNGIYPVRTGAYPNHTFADPWVKSMPHYLKKSGYRVGLIGKRHIGPKQNYPFEYLGDKVEGKDYLDLELSKKFLKEVSDSKEPFCLVVCSHQPHHPHTLGDRSLFDASKLTVHKNLVNTPEMRKVLVNYLAEINFMDSQVGTVLSQLKELSLDKNTLTVFLSEQGNSFAFSKWSCYEDGVKSAFIARWPGRIKAGSESSALVEYNDILPTFIDAAGGRPPKDLDGTSLLPLFRNPQLPGKKYAFSLQTTRGIIQGSDYFGIRAVTDGRYRYIYNLSPEVEFSNLEIAANKRDHWLGSWREKGATNPEAKKRVDEFINRPPDELYDLEADPDNLNNLTGSPEHAKVRESLRKALFQWMKDCGDKGLETELLAFQRMNAEKSSVPPKIGKLTEPKKLTTSPAVASYVPGEPFKGLINIPRDGYYTFRKKRKAKLTTCIRINGETVLPKAKKATYGIVGMKKGFHEIEIIPDPKEKPSDVRWSGPNQLPQPLEKAKLYKSR